MGVQVVRTEVPFVLDRDHLDLRRVLLDGDLVEFSVNYRIHVGGRWHVAVRYDNCHGAPHVHRFFEGRSTKLLPDAGTGLLALLAAAEEDLVANWTEYRRLMVGAIRQLEEGRPPMGDA
jgi:hypothetical protein